MDQVEGKEENRFQEPTTDRCKEDKEQNNSEESSVDQRKQEEEENGDEKESSEEATPEAAVVSLFAHPCSLLQYIARACACCLGLSDSFCDPKPSDVPVPPEPAAADPSQEGEEEGKVTRYFYMQEVTTGLRAARLRPKPPSNPREGSGGNGGHHH